ncbi:YrhB domain-containing protein [Streptomyces sp. NPDC001970]
MLSKNDAVEAGRAFLAEAYADEPWAIVVQPELSQEHPIARQVRFDSKEHLDAGEFGEAPFTRVVVVLVPKDGSPVNFPPSHIPVADHLDLPMRGEWPPNKA